MYDVSCVMYYVSRIMHYVLCIMYHVSCIAYHVSCITYHVYVSCIIITCYVSCVIGVLWDLQEYLEPQEYLVIWRPRILQAILLHTGKNPIMLRMLGEQLLQKTLGYIACQIGGSSKPQYINENPYEKLYRPNQSKLENLFGDPKYEYVAVFVFFHMNFVMFHKTCFKFIFLPPPPQKKKLGQLIK